MLFYYQLCDFVRFHITVDAYMGFASNEFFVLFCVCTHDITPTSTGRALTERIVAVLPQVSCSLAIQPHQIQGLDAASLLPVIQVTSFLQSCHH